MIDNKTVMQQALDALPDMTELSSSMDERAVYGYTADQMQAYARTAIAQPAKSFDSTPKLHVGESSFEGWYEMQEGPWAGDKQLARDAYAAGMGDPLVTYAQSVEPAAKHNFCPRCGKRLGGTDDIHTCTPPGVQS